MVNVCFQTIAFNSDEFLDAALESVAPFGPIVATEGPVAYWQQQGYTTSTDRTSEILHARCQHVVHGQWHEKDHMADAGARFIPPDTTHVWWLDADEVWHPDTIRAVLDDLDRWDAVAFRFNSFWCGFDHIIGGMEEKYGVQRITRWHKGATWATHRPPTVLAEDGLPYARHCLLGEQFTDARGWRCNHYSYCLPHQTLRKWQYYEARDRASCIPDWWRAVYLRWALADQHERDVLEQEHLGVHNWLPRVRAHNIGDMTSFTRTFTGSHPPSIQRRLDTLRAQFSEELRQAQEAGRV